MNLLTLLAQTTLTIDYDLWRLTLGGWIVMLLSVGFVTGLLGWCAYRVMNESSPEKVHSQIDIEPVDTVD